MRWASTLEGFPLLKGRFVMGKRKIKIESKKHISSGIKELQIVCAGLMKQTVLGAIDIKKAKAINNCSGKILRIMALKLADRKSGKYTPVFEELKQGLFEVFRGLKTSKVDAKTAGSIKYRVEEIIRLQSGKQKPIDGLSLETQLDDFRSRIRVIQNRLKIKTE